MLKTLPQILLNKVFGSILSSPRIDLETRKPTISTFAFTDDQTTDSSIAKTALLVQQAKPKLKIQLIKKSASFKKNPLNNT
ncbi:MAG: hypothetical protein KAH20_14350 [Methylococcales bacterium]|nr:hypothetical protein [Methylococcales bacterium]